MYNSVSREQIADTLIHLRGLFREIPTSSDKDDLAHERREILTKNLLSNLFRTKDHPTLNVVLEVADVFSLTLDGAHRLFGYELERIREYDLELNAGRTRIVETYPFERDRLVDLPFQFGGDEAFTRSATLQDLVLDWHNNTPIRALESGGWQQPNTFYVRVGTEDSLGSSLPSGSLAQVVPVDEAERICVPILGRFTCSNSVTGILRCDGCCQQLLQYVYRSILDLRRAAFQKSKPESTNCSPKQLKD